MQEGLLWHLHGRLFRLGRRGPPRADQGNAHQVLAFRLDEDSLVEPDFVFFKSSHGLVGLKSETCLLAVEIARSLLYDLNRKSRLYAAFGVREVWVINAQTLVTHIHRRPGLDGYQDKPEI